MLATISAQHKPGSSLDHFKSKKIEIDSVTGLPSIIPCDTIDNPILKKFFLERDTTEENIFLEMKHESNRLYSFKNRWPMMEIKPESLAEAGFFYLQQEDRVQCPFCYVIIYNWTRGDKPLREHMKKSPKCPFLVGSDVGNVSILAGKPKQISLTPLSEKKLSSVTAAYKPKHPKMADVKRRILTFSGWLLKKPGPQELAECGLYYTGLADVVTCFFCGGALGNWDPEDDPWTEHSKYFSECSFLAVTKNRHSKSMKIPVVPQKILVDQKTRPINGTPVSSVTSYIIEQALDIFPEPLVLDAVKRRHGLISSLQELCDDILELKQPSHHHQTSVEIDPRETNSGSESRPATEEAFLCKLCMDRERGALFQPCGHLVSCWQCSNLISDCPVCRKPIIHRIKTYLS